MPGGSARGGAGALDFLTAENIQEYLDAAIDCAARYLPYSLPMSTRVALILADINAESGFEPWLAQSNGAYGSSIGPMQVRDPKTLNPKLLFVQERF